jgi:hypothetical protein
VCGVVSTYCYFMQAVFQFNIKTQGINIFGSEEVEGGSEIFGRGLSESGEWDVEAMISLCA